MVTETGGWSCSYSVDELPHEKVQRSNLAIINSIRPLFSAKPRAHIPAPQKLKAVTGAA
jgi:hypothetical protein